MELRVFIKVVGEFNSEDLWACISHYKVNLTDLGNDVYVHGKMSPTVFLQVTIVCLQFGRLNIEVTVP